MTAPLRVGVLTPHAAAGPEVELPALAEGRVVVVAARIRAAAAGPAAAPPTTAGPLRALARGPALDRAVDALTAGPVDAVVHASTSTSYALGPRAEAALVRRLQDRCGVPVAASGAAAVAALRSAGARRVVLVHPPWFDPEIDALGVRYFADQGFAATLVRVAGLPTDPARVRPEQVVAEVGRRLDDGTDPLYLGGNGFRAAAAVADLGRRTGRVVLTANQALLRAVLAATGAGNGSPGRGRPLSATSPETDDRSGSPPPV